MSIALPGQSPRVALMQPTLLPWLGYFALIADADIFVFLDDFQFVRRSFHQRNRIFTAGNHAGFITVPIRHAGMQEIALNDAVPEIDKKFRAKTLKTVQHNYAGCAYFGDIFPVFSAWINAEYDNLAQMNIAFIKSVCGVLGLSARFEYSSQVGSTGQRSQRLVSLLDALNARTYLSARGSHDYMMEDGVFPLERCPVYFQDFAPVPYVQKQAAGFESHLSVLDALMQIGPRETMKNILAGRQPYQDWSTMKDMQEQDAA